MNTLTDEEIIKLLNPIIKKSLLQTNSQDRRDLEQEILLMILTNIRTKSNKEIPSFFRLLEKEYTSKTPSF